jgi:DNA polymerase (family X)
MSKKPTTDELLGLLSEIEKLMKLAGENPFKVRAFEKARGILGVRDDLLERVKKGTLTELQGIGKGISEVLTEFFQNGKSTVKEELQATLPPGLLELIRVPGLGPKKARVLLDELKIQTLGELEYACRENRLLKLKGFGEKVQKQILEGVQFLSAAQGKVRLVDALPAEAEILEILENLKGEEGRVSSVGDLRRRVEIVEKLPFLVQTEAGPSRALFEKKVASALEKFKKDHPNALPIEVSFSEKERFGYELARLTGSEKHWEKLGSPVPFAAGTEEEFYKKINLPWIPPEMRETGEEIELAKKGQLKSLLGRGRVRGVFHNHTNRSDGSHTLEQMVKRAKELGYEFIGISDHSQSAFYANGLKPVDLREQEKEIQAIQEKYPEIRIFWGIESDILQDGSLDYDEVDLKRFDFVIASIHSRFKMDEQAMTDRMIKAIQNPYTRFVGHLTGRLILGRKGYDLDMDKVIREAAKQDVAIEINAHPARLDIDWRWGSLLRKYQTKVSINPDAHSMDGLEDTDFGVTVARKALLPESFVVNARSVEEVEKWLKRS